MPNFSMVADGNIAPARFVTMSTTKAGRVTQATAGQQIFGVSVPQVRNAPYSSLDDGFTAIQGEQVGVFGPPDKDVMLEIGGTVTRGDRLKADANGKGVTTVTNLDEYGAIAQDSGTSGQLIPVQLVGPSQISS
jgi:hypothetical protein